MRRAFLACSLALSAVYAAEPTYQPLAVGNSWVYSVKGPDGSTVPMKSRITKSKKLGKTLAYEMEMTVGKERTTSLFYWTPGGLIQAESSILKFNPPFLEIKLPAKTGTKWDWAGTVTIGGIEYPATAHLSLSGPNKVTVPAGSFTAMTITRTVNVKTGEKTLSVNSTDSYVKGVGWVKGWMDQGGRKSTTELTSYKVGK